MTDQVQAQARKLAELLTDALVLSDLEDGGKAMAQEGEYGFVMPFNVCTSKGGPYEDQSFVAGFQTGAIFAMLEAAKAVGAASTLPHPVYVELLDQLDLIGMQFGFELVADLAEDPDWRLVWFQNPLA